MSESDANSAGECLAKVAGDAGIIGLNQYTDAIQVSNDSGKKIIYTADEEIRIVSRSGIGTSETWELSKDVTVDAIDDILTGESDGRSIEVIDKTTFNRLRSGPFDGESQFNDSRMWALVMHFQDFEQIAKASSSSLKMVPGIGEKLSRRAASALSAYPIDSD